MHCYKWIELFAIIKKLKGGGFWAVSYISFIYVLSRHFERGCKILFWWEIVSRISSDLDLPHEVSHNSNVPNFQRAGPTLSPVCQILTFALLKISINWMKIYATLKSYVKGVAYPFESLFFIRVVKIFLRIDCFSAKLEHQNEVSHNGDYPYFLGLPFTSSLLCRIWLFS